MRRPQARIALAAGSLLFIFISCENWILTSLMDGKDGTSASPAYPWESAPVYYIDSNGNDDTGDGTADYPWYSPQKAVNAIKTEAGRWSIPQVKQVTIVISGDITTGQLNVMGNRINTIMILVEGADMPEIVLKGGEKGGSIDGEETVSILVVGSGGKVTLAENLLLANANGAVQVKGGSFTMSGGEIGDNSTAAYGGGVYVDGGSFTMSGGVIYGSKTADTEADAESLANSAESGGAALWVKSGTAKWGSSGGSIGDTPCAANSDIVASIPGGVEKRLSAP
ncbi:MAG: hypothetical protein LBR23_07795 [Spirochaetaceae bacterium]|jgi:hypothetical protein|nr:hypothetical protein [Spirochaetaceae bacterium]